MFEHRVYIKHSKTQEYLVGIAARLAQTVDRADPRWLLIGWTVRRVGNRWVLKARAVPVLEPLMHGTATRLKVYLRADWGILGNPVR